MAIQQWEYMVHIQNYDFSSLLDNVSSFGQEANELGNAGWELATSEVVLRHQAGGMAIAGVLYTFKRPKVA